MSSTRARRDPAGGAAGNALIEPEIDRKIDAFVEVEVPGHLATANARPRRSTHDCARADDREVEDTGDRDLFPGRQHRPMAIDRARGW
jgi:hypothetical protein